MYGLEFDANAYVPFVERWPWSAQLVAQAFYEPLATFNDQGEVVPYLAERIESNPSFTEWTIKVRPGIRFHDGLPLDAEAVKMNLDKHGFTNFSPLEPVDHIEVVDPLTVRVVMKRPWAQFPAHLTGQIGNQVGYMASPSLIQADRLDAKPVGTGPFKFDTWVPSDRISGYRNPDYWQPGLPYVDAVEFRFIPDHHQRIAELQAGRLDAMITTYAAILDELPDSERFHVIEGSGNAPERFVLLNTEVAPLDDLRIRRALAHATDRQAVAEAVEHNRARPADGPYEPGSPWYAPTPYPDYDPEQARQLVAEYEADKGPVRIELAGWNSPDGVALQQVLADQWRAVGIDVSLISTTQRTLPVQAASGKYQAMTFRLFDNVDPDEDYMFLHSSSYNPGGAVTLLLSRLRDSQLDAALDEGRASNDPATRKRAYAKVQERLNATLPFIWLYHSQAILITSEQINGIEGAPLPDGSTAMTLVNGRHFFGPVWVSR
ncbi:MAG: ABC transporter substrate-binding protein [Acidimicrobiales bacterium]|nr:ABC transporter substrate-binding protein [Acidimicrobiales bacterium]